MSRHVAVIPGDGIGPEVVEAALKILDSLGLPLEYVFIEAGLTRWKRTGVAISEEDLEAIESCDALLKGPIATPTTPEGYRSVNVLLRKRLDLYANIRVFRSTPISPFRDVDIILFRENTEGLYSGVEFSLTQGVAVSLRVITEKGSSRLLRKAFEYARENGRRKVTVVHKANILRETCGLFIEVARRMAPEYPELEVDYMIVDAAAYALISRPSSFDVIATTNMFGDILSDEIAGLVGSMGICPSYNIGDRYAMFEAVHGAAFDIAGKGVANPVGLILSAAGMLKHLGFRDEAGLVEKAVWKALETREGLTPDMGGNGTTRTVTEKILKILNRERGFSWTSWTGAF